MDKLRVTGARGTFRMQQESASGLRQMGGTAGLEAVPFFWGASIGGRSDERVILLCVEREVDTVEQGCSANGS